MEFEKLVVFVFSYFVRRCDVGVIRVTASAGTLKYLLGQFHQRATLQTRMRARNVPRFGLGPNVGLLRCTFMESPNRRLRCQGGTQHLANKCEYVLQ